MKHIRRYQENQYKVNEQFWDSLFGKPTVRGAADDAKKSLGWSHTGRDSENAAEDENYIMLHGKKFYPQHIKYDDVYSTKEVPRIEGDTLIVANPAWSL